MRPEADGTLAWDATTIVVVHAVRRWPVGGRLHLRRRLDGQADPVEARGGRPRHRRHGPAGGLGGDGRGDPQPRASGHRFDGDRRGRHGAVGPEGAAAGAAALPVARPWFTIGCRSTAPAASPPTRSSGCSSSWADWVEQGIPRVKMKVGSDPPDDPERVRCAREAIGPNAELFVDANGAYSRKQALALAERFRAESAVSWLEEPVSSDDLEGLRRMRDRAPAGVDDRRRRVRLRRAYFGAHARSRGGRRPPGRRDPMRRDHRAAARGRALPRPRASRYRCTAGRRSICIRRWRCRSCVTWSTSTTTSGSSSSLFDGVLSAARRRAVTRI